MRKIDVYLKTCLTIYAFLPLNVPSCKLQQFAQKPVLSMNYKWHFYGHRPPIDTAVFYCPNHQTANTGKICPPHMLMLTYCCCRHWVQMFDLTGMQLLIPLASQNSTTLDVSPESHNGLVTLRTWNKTWTSWINVSSTVRTYFVIRIFAFKMRTKLGLNESRERREKSCRNLHLEFSIDRVKLMKSGDRLTRIFDRKLKLCLIIFFEIAW